MRLALAICFVLTSLTLYGQSVPNGITWDDTRYNKLPLKYDYGKSTEILPAAYSLKPYCPKVINQTAVATSAAWAAIWYGQSIGSAALCNQRNIDSITQKAYSPLFAYRLANPKLNCTTAVNQIDVLEIMKEKGSPRFSQFNDLCPLTIPNKVYDQAQTYRIAGYIKLFNEFDPQTLKTASIKRALCAKHAVVANMIIPKSFHLAEEFWQPREEADTTTQGAQAITIVGYNDQKFGGAFEVVNQWGKTWGDKGFTWIRYADMSKFVRYGFELVSTSPCSKALGAKIVLYKDDGSVFKELQMNNTLHTLDKSLPENTKFKISIKANTDGFAYVFTADETELTTLFPSSNLSAYLFSAITLPHAGSYYQVEGNEKTLLYFVFSPTEIAPDVFEELIRTNTLYSSTGKNKLTLNSQLPSALRVAVLEL